MINAATMHLFHDGSFAHATHPPILQICGRLVFPTIYIEPDAGCCSPIKSMRDGSFWSGNRPCPAICPSCLSFGFPHCAASASVCPTLCRPGRLVKCSGISRNKKNQVLIYKPTVRVAAAA